MTIPLLVKKYLIVSVLLIFRVLVFCQDSSVLISHKMIMLKEVVVRNKLNVAGFIERIQRDTSFYKAFRNLRVLGYTSLNDVRMMDKKGMVQATLQSKTRQTVSHGCRTMETLSEQTTGNIYDAEKNWNYYTAELYAGIFFSRGTICNETNIVKDYAVDLRGKSGLQKHKEQLKMLIFSPGTKIPGIPFIGNKVAVFEDGESGYYDFTIDMDNYRGQNCYVFDVRARKDLTSSEKDNIVINSMVTWFNSQTMEIVAREYDMSYNAAIYDFNVHMRVELDKFEEYLVPMLIRYTGNWHAIFKKRENGFFTATLFNFNH